MKTYYLSFFFWKDPTLRRSGKNKKRENKSIEVYDWLRHWVSFLFLLFFQCFLWLFSVPVFSCLLHRSVYQIRRDQFFQSKECHQRNKTILHFFKESCKKACHIVLKEYNGLLKSNCLLKNTFSTFQNNA